MGMRTLVVASAASLLLSACSAVAVPVVHQNPYHDQVPLVSTSATTNDRPLHGRFLHISDLHLDPFYASQSSTGESSVCHRGTGSAGHYGAETTDCDSPFALINATFSWIQANLADSIDFVLWTGDSARHDNDESHPRSAEQVESLNKFCTQKFLEVFSHPDHNHDPSAPKTTIPIVPTLGNNDITPHNIFHPGPNRWTKSFLQTWHPFIPAHQRHTFAAGGWFSAPLIPGKLTALSLNSLYFFASNAAVENSCLDPSQPGYAQFEWMRVQLQMLRERGQKAVLLGHVPPARTPSREAWDEGCWQVFAIWMRRYRDVVVGSVWGHMNVDHFLLQDFGEVDVEGLAAMGLEGGEEGEGEEAVRVKAKINDEVGLQSTAEYLTELREIWSELPKAPGLDKGNKDVQSSDKEKNKKKKEKEKEFFKKIGGPFAERFSLSLVSPSVVPNYYPTLRVVEYNISGLDSPSHPVSPAEVSFDDEEWDSEDDYLSLATELESLSPTSSATATQTQTDTKHKNKNKSKKNKHKKKKKKKKKKGKHPKKLPKLPKTPSKTALPGPAYSPQPLTWTKYTQYYANLTTINAAFEKSSVGTPNPSSKASEPGSESGFESKTKPGFEFEIEYETQNDAVYDMPDLTVLSYVQLAGRVGAYKHTSSSHSHDLQQYQPQLQLGKEAEVQGSGETEKRGGEMDVIITKDSEDKGEGGRREMETERKGKKDRKKKKKDKKKKKKKKRKLLNKTWETFVWRAFVGSMDKGKLEERFGVPVSDDHDERDDLDESDG